MRSSDTFGHVLTVGGITALSRVLGLVREMLQSRLIGAGVEQSAFTLAFALPNMMRKVFGEGALTAAFVPIFKEELARGETESARRLARAVLSVVLLILGAISLLVVTGLWVAGAIATDLSPRAVLTLRLVRILTPYMIFICGAAFGMGVLNALRRFVEGAFMPALLNVLWILALGVLAFFPSLPVETRVTVVCWTILAGGAAQMLFLFRCMAKRGFAPRLTLKGAWSGRARECWTNTALAAFGAGAVQLNYLLDQFLAQVASPWAAGVIGYAERLMDLPLGIIGVAFGTVLLPTFAGLFARQDVQEARQVLHASLVHMAALMLPAAAGLFVLAPEITSVIYEGHAFDAQATVRVSRALAVYALGLGFFGCQKSLVPWFQAQGDMKTPLRVSCLTVACNAVLNVLAVVFLPVEGRPAGLAASTVVCAAIGCALLVRRGVRKNGSLGLGTTVAPLAKITAASLAMAFLLVAARRVLPTASPFVLLLVLVPLGILAYAALYALLIGSPRQLLKRRARR